MPFCCPFLLRKSLPELHTNKYLRIGPTLPPNPHIPLPISVELQKANLEGTAGAASGTSTSPSPLASAIPLAQLLSKAPALGALNSLTALGGLTELLSGATATPNNSSPSYRNHKNYNQRRQDDDVTPPKKERNKYNPY